MPSLRVGIPEAKGKFKELLASAAEEVGTAARGRDQGGGSRGTSTQKSSREGPGRPPIRVTLAWTGGPS